MDSPVWSVILLTFVLGIFTGFQGWVGLMLVNLLRDVAVLKTGMDGHQEKFATWTSTAGAAQGDHEQRLRVLESRRSSRSPARAQA